MGQISEMQTFVRVVEAGSISKAAEQLDMAKSGVSRRLSELESRLGVRLLNRTTSRSSLTEAGQSYYESAVKLLADISELNTATSDISASLLHDILVSPVPAARLRVAASLLFICIIITVTADPTESSPEVFCTWK